MAMTHGNYSKMQLPNSQLHKTLGRHPPPPSQRLLARIMQVRFHHPSVVPTVSTWRPKCLDVWHMNN